MESMNDAWRKRKIKMDGLWQFTQINRVSKVISPYAQMMLSD